MKLRPFEKITFFVPDPLSLQWRRQWATIEVAEVAATAGKGRQWRTAGGGGNGRQWLTVEMAG
jgi:hypothetical protein